MTRLVSRGRFGIFVLGVTATIAVSGCGGGSGTPPPVPVIQNINSSTTPTSPVGLPIEINGSGFQAAPGKVNFKQGSTSVDVVPAASAWSDTGLVAVVPTTLTTPGTVSVTVVTSGGTSNAVTLNLIQTLSFSPSNLVWTTTTALPTALTGLRAIGVKGSTTTSAYVVVTGGSDLVTNSTTVLSNTLNADGTVGANWATITTNPLPSARAHHAMAEADDTNSLVTAGKRYIYAIGGQQASTDAPGGTNTVFMASVDATTGAVGTWTTATNALPTAAAAAFGTMFAFGGKLYFIGGDPNNSITPNTQGVGTNSNNVYYASSLRGTVGMWTLNTNLINKGRAKGILFAAFGQVILGEGIYSGRPGSSEFERSSVNADGTLAAWNGLTGSNVPSANVYNAGAIVSPLISPAQTPRFLLFGGQKFVTTGTGTLSSTVYVNNAP